jgi:ribosomal protein L12E/L44/L45/RPP1/RPP2
VYVTHWLNKLEKAGWVKLEKQGRLKTVVATENGVAIASMLDELVHKMDAHTSKGAAAGSGTAEAEAAKKEKAAGEAKEKEKKQE